MTTHLTVRPAGLAIAAFLASVSPAAMAQMVAPPALQPAAPVQVAPPPVVNAAPVIPGQAAPTFAPNQPVVQQTPSVEARRDAAIAAAEADSSAAPAQTTRNVSRTASAPVARAVRTEAPARADTARAETPAPTQPQTQNRSEATPMAATPVATPQSVPVAVAPPTVPVVATPADNVNGSLLWIVGGGALLLLGLGASAAMRRRRRNDGVTYEEERPVFETRSTPVAPQAASFAPVAAPMVHEPVTPERVAPTPTGNATLEAMVAAPPSRENPFRTPSKRLRRARFLIARREAAMVAERAPAASPPQTIAAEDRSQTIFRFGKHGQRADRFNPKRV